MATSTDVVLRAKGVDQASAIFSKIGGVLASLGVAKGLRDAIAELGKLSDVAMNAGVSTDQLTQLSGAFDRLGIKGADVDSIARSMQMMLKNTGEAGVSGFEKVINSIATLGSAEERAQAAMAAFGRSGLNYLPLIEAAAKNGGTSISDLAATMPAVAQAAADAGDAVNDSINYIVNFVKTGFLNTIGEVAKGLDGLFVGGIRQAVQESLVILQTWCTKTIVVFQELFSWLKDAATLNVDAYTHGLGERIKKEFATVDELAQKDLEKIWKANAKGENAFATSVAGGVAEAASPMPRRGGGGGKTKAEWMEYGSYAAATLGLNRDLANDPLLRETRTQTSLLKKIQSGIASQKQAEQLAVLGG